MDWDETARRELAADLEDNAIQPVAGNLLRYDTIRRLLESGRTLEANALLHITVETQRAILEELRRISSRIAHAPSYPSEIGSQPSSS